MHHQHGHNTSPDEARPVAVGIVERLRAAGHTAYFAGGCVRDELLGLHPADFDVATDARPTEISTLFPRTNEVGVAFGVMLVHTDRVVTEVATFRDDGTYSDRRRPDSVSFSTPEQDALRRDFTINALFLDPLVDTEQGGRVIDFVGGRDDLKAGVVRAVGDADARLREDDLRSLRAVRFAARLGFTIDPATDAAIRAHAGELAGISRERIGDEIRRVFRHPTRAAAAELIERLGLSAPVFGPDPGKSGPPAVMVALPADATIATVLMAHAIDRGLDPYLAGPRGQLVARWRRLLCLSNDERDTIAGGLRTLADLTHAWPSLGVAGQKRLAMSPWFEMAMQVLTAWKPSAAAGITERLAELNAIGAGLAPEPLIDGERLISFGFQPGPAFKRILDRVYDAQLEGRVNDLAAAERLARELSDA